MKIRAPWWCCFGWSRPSLVCLADNIGHLIERALPSALRDKWQTVRDPICERHDRLIIGAPEKPLGVGTFYINPSWINTTSTGNASTFRVTRPKEN